VDGTREFASPIISLHALRNGQDQDDVDYIDRFHPGLKEQISNLFSINDLIGLSAGLMVF
jgi:hypothetical protein